MIKLNFTLNNSQKKSFGVFLASEKVLMKKKNRGDVRFAPQQSNYLPQQQGIDEEVGEGIVLKLIISC